MGTGFSPVFVWIALGTNQGNRLENMRKARFFLEHISESESICSSLYETEPIGPADKAFYNAAVRISTTDTPEQLLQTLKQYERDAGRDLWAPRWSNRIIDLDIIAFQGVRIELDWLQIPHKEYTKRRFVLVPLQEIEPGWNDPLTSFSIHDLLRSAPELSIQKLDLPWQTDLP